MSKPNNSENNSSDSDTDSEEENLNLEITEKNKNKNNEKTTVPIESKKTPDEIQNEKKRKRKIRFQETHEKKNNDVRKEKVRKVFHPPQEKPIIINLMDLFNPDRSQNFFQEQLPPSPPPKNNYIDPAFVEDDYDDEFPMENKYLDINLENIDDLIKLGQEYINGKYSPIVKYNINVYRISKLVEPLLKLKK